MATIHDRLKRALEARGETFVKTTAHYTVYTRAAGGFYFIGPAGALRMGKQVSSTASLTDGRFYRDLLNPPTVSGGVSEGLSI